MTSWIFQGNPDRFDIDAYLAFAPDRITWLVNQYRNAVQPGDQVFLWRARGNGSAGPAGIVAEFLVDSPVVEMEDDPSAIPFWRESGETGLRHRVWLKVVRVAANILERGKIASTRGLEAVGPIGFGNATNFQLSETEARELNRIWHNRTAARSEERTRTELDEQAVSLQQSPLARLLEQYHQRSDARTAQPRRSQATAFVFERDPYVVAIARVRAGFRCELPGCQSPSFLTDSGARYCEVHHIVPLAEGGVDSIENAACVCSNHHRELHVGKGRNELRQRLINVRDSR
jgi:hypothetical protein